MSLRDIPPGETPRLRGPGFSLLGAEGRSRIFQGKIRRDLRGIPPGSAQPPKGARSLPKGSYEGLRISEEIRRDVPSGHPSRGDPTPARPPKGARENPSGCPPGGIPPEGGPGKSVGMPPEGGRSPKGSYENQDFRRKSVGMSLWEGSFDPDGFPLGNPNIPPGGDSTVSLKSGFQDLP